MHVAIHPDDYRFGGPPEKYDAASPRWAQLLESAGHDVKWVDVRAADILDQLAGCDGFMWRWAHFRGMGRIARRLLPVIERELGLLVYPDQSTCWHYDDKLAQAYLLEAAELPIPRTWIWFDANAAGNWVKTATYPLVLKLASGASSSNVRLLHDDLEAGVWIDRLFKCQVTNLTEEQFQPLNFRDRIRAAAEMLKSGGRSFLGNDGLEPQSGYVLFQEFLPDNPFDTRVTVIGNRAFAFRRFNRAGDFRASGSGKIDWDPNATDQRFVKLAFEAARRLKIQSGAIDGLYRNGECVIGEISYTYALWAVYRCPGHWRLDRDAKPERLTWVPGQMRPEDAQVADFLQRLADRRSPQHISHARR